MLIRDLEALVGDLGKILAEAKSYEFHDFKNHKYALPKTMLKVKLEEIVGGIIEGKYDNAFFGEEKK